MINYILLYLCLSVFCFILLLKYFISSVSYYTTGFVVYTHSPKVNRLEIGSTCFSIYKSKQDLLDLMYKLNINNKIKEIYTLKYLNINIFKEYLGLFSLFLPIILCILLPGILVHRIYKLILSLQDKSIDTLLSIKKENILEEELLRPYYSEKLK